MQAIPHTKEIAHNLTINQRNIYLYYLNHRSKHKNAPCFVPKLGLQGTRLPDYLKALEVLERKKLISVDRSASNYTGWIILDPPEA